MLFLSKYVPPFLVNFLNFSFLSSFLPFAHHPPSLRSCLRASFLKSIFKTTLFYLNMFLDIFYFLNLSSLSISPTFFHRLSSLQALIPSVFPADGRETRGTRSTPRAMKAEVSALDFRGRKVVVVAVVVVDGGSRENGTREDSGILPAPCGSFSLVCLALYTTL